MLAHDRVLDKVEREQAGDDDLDPRVQLLGVRADDDVAEYVAVALRLLRGEDGLAVVGVLAVDVVEEVGLS